MKTMQVDVILAIAGNNRPYERSKNDCDIERLFTYFFLIVAGICVGSIWHFVRGGGGGG